MGDLSFKTALRVRMPPVGNHEQEGVMGEQVHKRVTDEQMKMIMERYLWQES